MKIILRQDMDPLGLEGDLVTVADGYARNYLIPKGFALEANNQNIKLMEMQKKKIEVKRIKAKEIAEKIKEEILDMVINISQKVGEEEKLYGSVTSMDIAAQMDKKGYKIYGLIIVIKFNHPLKQIHVGFPVETFGGQDIHNLVQCVIIDKYSAQY